MNNEEKILSLLEAMNDRFDKVDARLDRIERDQADMKADMSGMKADMSDLKADTASIDKRLATVSDSVVRIEHEHGKKLDALFDGYQQVYDKVSHVEEHVSVQDDIILKRVFPKAAER